MTNKRRVVITGIGALTPVGNNTADIWANLVAGRSGISEITLFDTTDYAIKVAGEVKGFAPDDWLDPKEARHMDRSVQFAVAAAQQAIRDARLNMEEEDADRAGIIFGSAAGGVSTLLAQQKVLEERGTRRVSPPLPPQLPGRLGFGPGRHCYRRERP